MAEEGKEPYPCRDLAGCGVAFKFIQALQRNADLPKSMLSEALDMVAVGTIGDIVPLKDENRTLVKYGIAAANSGRRPSLSRLAEAISLDEITSSNIAFGIVPHINASGRMASAMAAVELFNSTDDDVIDNRIQQLIQYNRQRKSIQEEAFNKCTEMISGDENFIVLKVSDMHEGIAGIVAGKIKDRYSRPAIIVTPSDEVGRGDGDVSLLKGTGRSIDGVNIYEVLNNCSDLFIRFGGHSKACGFLMEENNLDSLVESVNRDLESQLSENPDLFAKAVEFDAEIPPEEVTVELARELMKRAPFGDGNPEPVFLMRNVSIKSLSYMGANDVHARFSACAPMTGPGADGRNAYAGCVLFRKAQELKSLLEGREKVNITGTVSHQVWRGQERVQFIVEDIDSVS